VEVASLSRRLLASLVDGVVTVTPVVLATGGGIWLYLWYDRRRSGSNAVKGPNISPGDGPTAAFRRFGESRRWQIALSVGVVPIEVRMRNWRSPGMRVMGLRRADARTGGPVTVRSLLVRKAVVTAWQDLVRRALRPSDERFRERGKLMRADLEEARQRLADDPEALDRARREITKRYRVTPWIFCSRGLLSSTPLYLPALWSERNQTLPDRLAGIVVVRD
jgi:hypothetical protein